MQRSPMGRPHQNPPPSPPKKRERGGKHRLAWENLDPLPEGSPPPRVHVNAEQEQPSVQSAPPPPPVKGPVRLGRADGLFVPSRGGGAFGEGFARRRKVGYGKDRF